MSIDISKRTKGIVKSFGELNVQSDSGEFICSCGVNGRSIEALKEVAGFIDKFPCEGMSDGEISLLAAINYRVEEIVNNAIQSIEQDI